MIIEICFHKNASLPKNSPFSVHIVTQSVRNKVCCSQRVKKKDKNFRVSETRGITETRCVRHRGEGLRINSVCSYRSCTRCAVCSEDREVSPVEQSLKATSARYIACIICWPTARAPLVRQILFSCVSSIAQTAMEITATA